MVAWEVGWWMQELGAWVGVAGSEVVGEVIGGGEGGGWEGEVMRGVAWLGGRDFSSFPTEG
jgi:hypothetical protein